MQTCCVSGAVSSGKPSGKLEAMACGSVYVSTPDAKNSSATTAVIIATDVFGLSPNAKLLADAFAQRGGVLTVIPDMFEKTALPVWIMDAVATLMKKKKKKDKGKDHKKQRQQQHQ